MDGAVVEGAKKRAKSKSPTQRTLEWMRKAGFVAHVVERWNAFAKIRQDAFGFADIIGLHPDHRGTVYVQATSATNHASRRTKLEEEPRAHLAKLCGNEVWVVSWKKDRKSGRWEPRCENMEFAAAAA